MATLAAIFKRSEGNVATAEEPRENWDWAPDPYQLRPFPSEDVYFYCKKVDNGRLRREADPLAHRKCWHAATMAFAAALFLMILMLPDALGMMAGYQIDSLSREHARLLRDRRPPCLARNGCRNWRAICAWSTPTRRTSCTSIPATAGRWL